MDSFRVFCCSGRTPWKTTVPPAHSGWLAHLTAGTKDTLYSRRDSPGERKPPSIRGGARRAGRACCLNRGHTDATPYPRNSDEGSRWQCIYLTDALTSQATGGRGKPGGRSGWM